MTCMIDVDFDGNSPRFFRQEIRKARKAHECVECGKCIAPGETYEYVVGAWDQGYGPDTYKTCDTCRSIRDAMLCGFYYGMLWEQLREWFNNDYGEDLCVEPLDDMTPAARAKFIEWFDAAVEDYEWEELCEQKCSEPDCGGGTVTHICPKGKHP